MTERVITDSHTIFRSPMGRVLRQSTRDGLSQWYFQFMHYDHLREALNTKDGLLATMVECLSIENATIWVVALARFDDHPDGTPDHSQYPSHNEALMGWLQYERQLIYGDPDDF